MSILLNEFANTQKLKSNDSNFPDILRKIDDPPMQLYVKGSLPKSWINLPKVAIVGSRQASGYGRTVTQSLSTELATQGVVIISGLALGIDSIAHQAALDVGGITVAVLPSPLAHIYPASHYNLARKIVASGGSLLSEYSDDDAIYKVNFVARNRIVSGLADILIITEAAEASGTMHTARFALNQGKTVMAVPGNITQTGSKGTNNLIKSGAIPVTETKDILFALNLPLDQHTIPDLVKLTDSQAKLLQLIKKGVIDQYDLTELHKDPAANLNSDLTMLEIAGYIKPLGASQWMAI